MAIIKVTAATPTAKVIDQLMYKKLPSGTTKLQLANQNRSAPTNAGFRGGASTSNPSASPRANFQTLDQSISALDAHYDGLSDKSPWENYAAEIDGDWNLCATCSPVLGGKKLFRQYNLNRQRIGKAWVDAPEAGATSAPVLDTVVTFDNVNPSETFTLVELEEFDVDVLYLTPMNTNAYFAPILKITSANYGYVSPADPNTAAFVQACRPWFTVNDPPNHSGIFTVCGFLKDGSPGLNREISVGLYGT